MTREVRAPGQGVRLNITLDEVLFCPITLSLSKGENRSDFLAEAAREHLARRSAPGLSEDYAETGTQREVASSSNLDRL
jgi:hypothetical protein